MERPGGHEGYLSPRRKDAKEDERSGKAEGGEREEDHENTKERKHEIKNEGAGGSTGLARDFYDPLLDDRPWLRKYKSMSR